jgi:predicted MFS family arabinose efflux permease
MTLGAGVIVALWLPSDRLAQDRATVRPRLAGNRPVMRDLLGNPALLSTCVVGFAILFSMVAIFTYSGFRLAAPPLGVDSSTIAHVFAVFLLGIPAMPTTGPAIRRFGRPRVITAAVVLKALGLACTLVATLPMITVGLALFSLGTFISQPTAIGFAGIASPHSRSVAVGLYVSAYYLGGTLGGVAPAWLWDRYGWTSCVALVAAVDLIALGLALTTWRRPLPHSGPAAA